MKKALLAVAALVLWVIGVTVATLLGDVYMAAIHPDGQTYATHFWRSIVFAIPDMLVLASHLFVSGGAVSLSPYPKVVAAPMLAWALYSVWQLSTGGVLHGQSSVVHWVATLLALLFGVLGLFGKRATAEA
jgi:hypothetical protein